MAAYCKVITLLSAAPGIKWKWQKKLIALLHWHEFFPFLWSVGSGSDKLSEKWTQYRERRSDGHLCGMNWKQRLHAEAHALALFKHILSITYFCFWWILLLLICFIYMLYILHIFKLLDFFFTSEKVISLYQSIMTKNIFLILLTSDSLGELQCWDFPQIGHLQQKGKNDCEVTMVLISAQQPMWKQNSKVFNHQEFISIS